MQISIEHLEKQLLRPLNVRTLASIQQLIDCTKKLLAQQLYLEAMFKTRRVNSLRTETTFLSHLRNQYLHRDALAQQHDSLYKAYTRTLTLS